MSVIPISLTLRSEARTLEGVAQVEQAASALGMKPIAAGRSTVSCRVSFEKFAELFGRPALLAVSLPPGSADQGTPGGYMAVDLSVPVELEKWVESLSVTPPATRY